MKIMDAALGRLKFNDVVAVTKLTYGEFYQKAIERFEQGYYFEAQRESYERWITGKSIERDRIRIDNLTNLAFLTDSMNGSFFSAVDNKIKLDPSAPVYLISI